MKKKQHYDMMGKLIIIGDSGVGKTNIILNFVGEKFKQNYVATIGVDFKTKTIEIDNRKIKLQIWDTAGQQRYRTITETYYKGASAIIFAYALNNRSSFQSLQKWISQIGDKVPASVPKLIIANKNDLQQTDRIISTEQGRKLAQKYIPSEIEDNFIQVSAKTGENIIKAFEMIAKRITNSEQTERSVTKISSRMKQQENSTCCLK